MPAQCHSPAPLRSLLRLSGLSGSSDSRFQPAAPGLALILVLSLGFASGVHAQSLQEVYEAARSYDATYLSARALLESAQYRLAQARGLRLPTLGLQISRQRAYSDTPAAATRDSRSLQTGATLNGSQPLFNRTNDVTIAQTEKGVDISTAEFDIADQDLILRVAQAYFDVLTAQDTLASARGNLAAIAEQVASAKRNFEVGTATITDTREAQARFDLARATQIVAENDLLTRRIALDTLVGRSNVTPNPLAVPVAVPAIAPANVEDWLTRADTEHPLVRRARLVLDVARLETDKAKAGHLPNVALTASYGMAHATINGTAVQSGFPNGGSFSQSGNNIAANVGVLVNVPLFAGYQVENRVKETLVLETKSQNDLEAQRRGVAQGTRTAFYGVSSGAAQVRALEAAESSSQLALAATQLGYQVGVRVNLDVLNAQAQLFTTQAQLAKARYDVVLAGLRLRQASGRITPEDVAAASLLLKP